MTTLRKILLNSCCLFMFLFAPALYSKTIHILAFNDFHSRLYPTSSSGSFTPGLVFFMNAILSEIKKDEKDGVILVSGGDNYQGIIVSFETKGECVSDMFKALGVAVSAVGNHEFDWGLNYFNKWQKNGNFTYLAANLIDKKTKKIPSWAKPYKIFDINGVKIAFIGLCTLETQKTTSAKNVANFQFVDPWISAQYWINYLKANKAKEGKIDVIVALTHIPSFQDSSDKKIVGEEINNLCTRTKGLDIVLSGHSHETVCGNINGIVVLQSECYGRKYGVLDITVSDTNRKIDKIDAKVVTVPFTGVKILKDNTGEKILEKYSSLEKKYTTVIGKTDTDLSYNPLILNSIGVFIVKLMADKFNTQIAFMNCFAIRGGLNKGNITIGDLYKLFPFDDGIVTMKLSGQAIKTVIEHGLDNYGVYKIGCIQFYGLKVLFDSTKTLGNRVISITLLDGSKLNMNKYYSVCTSDFMYSGGDGYNFPGAKDVKIYDSVSLRALIINKIKEIKVLSLPQPNYLKDVSLERRQLAA